jgi:chitin disaccharide deacetylase
MKHLIVNGDDFGASLGISRGILEAHEHGVLTSTSLMVNTPVSEAAARLARSARGLSVGLHADLTAEMREPDITLGRRLAAELDRQLQRFEKLMHRGPTHLDAHHNLHRDQRALPHFLELAERHGLPLREHSPVRYLPDFYGQWGGATHREQISPEGLARLLETEIGEGITELSCHPGYVEPSFVTSYAAERAVEVRTLCDPLIRQVLAEEAIQLVNYHDLARLVPGLAEK